MLSAFLKIRMVALLRRNPNFAVFSAGNGVSLVGMWMERIAIGWLAWQLTESGLWLGVVAFADFFPVVLIAPLAGAFADGIVVAFNQPARLALVPSLVAPADLAGAVAINSVFFNLARFVGPVFAGLAIVWWSIAGAFLINTLSYIGYLIALSDFQEIIAPSYTELARDQKKLDKRNG